MRLNKSFIGTTRQSKLDSLKSFFAIIFWLLISIIIAVLFTFTLNTLYPSSYVSELINNQGVSFIYTMWTVQATVTVLAFFISNIMTSIVKDVFYGLSIRDILIARVKWYEVSFWHQSIVCILLVIINIPFILLGLTPAVLVIVSFNLLFII
jgi:multidrug transporter EmrE-like cation transporter